MKISIITVNFNDKTGLEKTLQSSIRLTLPVGVEKEIVVIDGGSKDGSVDVLKKYLSDITYWVSEKDRGIFHAMNKGVAAASGDYCIFMNSGDSFASENVLEKIFANPYPEMLNADVITGGTFYINPEENTEEFGLPPNYLSLGFFYNKTLQHQSSFIKTERLRQFPYDETLKITADIKFWIQCLILDNGKYISTGVPVAKFDLSGVNARPEGAEGIEVRRIFSDLKLDKIICDYDLVMKPKNFKMRICRHFFSRALKKFFQDGIPK